MCMHMYAIVADFDVYIQNLFAVGQFFKSSHIFVTPCGVCYVCVWCVATDQLRVF